MAFRRGEDNQKALVGALMLADGLDCLQSIRTFLIGMSAAKKRGRHG